MSWATIAGGVGAGLSAIQGFQSARSQRKLAKESARYLRQLGAMDAERFGEWRERGIPLLRLLADEALEGPGGEDYAAAAGTAAANVDSAYDQARGRLDRSLARYGGPGGLHAGALRQLALARAGDRAGAMTESSRLLDDQAYGRRLDAIRLLAP